MSSAEERGAHKTSQKLRLKPTIYLESYFGPLLSVSVKIYGLV